MPAENYCQFNGEVMSKEILEYITGDKDFNIDDVQWDENISVPEDLMSSWKTDVDPVTIEELTSRKAFGSGVFDAMMESIHNHLKVEYDAGRITGATYADTYTKLSEAALGNAVQFCLQKNQAYFAGLLAQAQAVSAGIQAQVAVLTAKMQLVKAKAEALGVAAQYALTTMKLATEDAQHALLCHQAAILNPHAEDGSNVDFLIKQGQLDAQEAQARMAKYQADSLDPEATAGAGTNIDFLLKEKQLESADKNIAHITNQMEVEDRQKDLYVQQKKSFQYKSEKDVADLFANTYLTMKSVDEGLAIPKAFSGASINDVMQTLKVNIGLGEDTTTVDSYAVSGTNYSGISDKPEAGTTADKAYLQYGILSAEEEEESTGNNG